MVVGIFVAEFGGFDLPWYGVLIAYAIAIVSIVPTGIIFAISGQSIGLDVFSDFISSLIFPGRVASVMTFKSFSFWSLFQGLYLTQDLKLAHYLKLPPRHCFLAQLWASLLSVIVNIFTTFFVYESFGKSSVTRIDPFNPLSDFKWKIQSPETASGWDAQVYYFFFNESVMWSSLSSV
jgi:hypothetical protein